VFPGLPDELVRKIKGYTTKMRSNNSNNGYKPFTNMTKLSPGDDLLYKDGRHTVVTHTQFVGPSGYYKGQLVGAYRKKTRGGRKTRKHIRR